MRHHRPILVDKPAIGGHAPSRSLGIEHDGFGKAASLRNACGECVEIAHVVPRADGVDQHLHAAAADQAVVPTVIVIEMERHDLGPPLVEQEKRAAFHLGFDTAASQGARLRAIREDEHGGPGLLGRRAASFDEGRIRNGPPIANCRFEIGEDVGHRARFTA